MTISPPPGTPQHLIDLVNKIHEKTDHMEKMVEDMRREKMRSMAEIRTNEAFRALVEQDKAIAREVDDLERIVLDEDRLEEEQEAKWAKEDEEIQNQHKK
jgi:hypothetical protein